MIYRVRIRIQIGDSRVFGFLDDQDQLGFDDIVEIMVVCGYNWQL